MPIVVPPAGPSPNPVLLVGEAPGRREAEERAPFVGPSGRYQSDRFLLHNLRVSSFRRTNIVQIYREGNPDPDPDLIREWTPALLDEIRTCQPLIILAVGRFAARWFLGEETELETCWGLPYRVGAFQPRTSRTYEWTRYLKAPSHTVIVPLYHPAGGLWNPESRTIIDLGYDRAAEYVKSALAGREIQPVEDVHAGREIYLDVGGEDLCDLLDTDSEDLDGIPEIGLDTEGTPGQEWSVQVSTRPGTGYVLRTSQPDFPLGIQRLQYLADSGTLFILHNAGTPSGCMYDVRMCRGMGLDLSRARIWDTMYAAFLLCVESKSLKDLSLRWLGMRMTDYARVIGDAGRAKQVRYLEEVVQREKDWPGPEPAVIRENDGTYRVTTPWPVHRLTAGILRDVSAGKTNKDGEPVDPFKRWKDVPRTLRRPVEQSMGPIPIGTLDDAPLDDAIIYAARDADATLRLKSALHRELKRLDLLPLMKTASAVLPIFEEFQRVGMPASRSRFHSLHAEISERMDRLQEHISRTYYGGRPFNPASDKQFATLLRRRGLTPEKRTEGGRASVAKDSIGHLRSKDPAVAAVLDWKEMQKLKGTYIEPVLEIAESEPVDPENPDAFEVHTAVKPVTVVTRRLSSEKPSLLNQPIRTELGRRLRDCYVTTGSEVFGAWDYSGQEMRVAADVSGDELLCHLFSHCRYCGCDLNSLSTSYSSHPSRCRKSPDSRHEGGDTHTASAVRVFGIPEDRIDKFNHRLPAKTANFGILYGLSGPGLQDLFRTFGLVWPVEDCEKLVREILRKVYPGLADSIRRVGQETARTGMVRDRFGMIRYLPAVWSREAKEAAEARRQAFSHLIQGTAQGMMQSAMAWMRPRVWELVDQGMDVRWCLQIHDEVILRMGHASLWDVVDPIVMRGIIHHSGIKLRVPIEAEGHMATSWGKLK